MSDLDWPIAVYHRLFGLAANQLLLALVQFMFSERYVLLSDLNDTLSIFDKSQREYAPWTMAAMGAAFDICRYFVEIGYRLESAAAIDEANALIYALANGVTDFDFLN